MPVVLLETSAEDLAPVARLRPVADLTVGARTIREKWERAFGGRVEVGAGPPVGPGLFIDSRALPYDVAEEGPEEVGVLADGTVVHLRLGPGRRGGEGLPRRVVVARLVRRPWDLVRWQAGELRNDLKGIEGIVRDGADVHPSAVLDDSDGPVLVEAGARVGPLAVLSGPCRIGPGAVVHPHTHVRGSSVGEGSKIGGEVSASTILSFANKQHLGFLGHSYVSSWTNLGAGATTSNLKNTYGEVRVEWGGVRVGTGLQYLGAIVGDHAKVGINASLPTGCVIGVGANLYGAGTLPKEVPDFVFGGPEAGYVEARLADVLRTAETVLGRRGRRLCAADRAAVERAYRDSVGRRTAWLADRRG